MGIRSRYKRLQRLSDGPFPALTIRVARRFLIDYPDFGPAWLLLGIALFEMARYEEAEQAIGKGIDLWPSENLRIPLAQMGHLFQEAGDYDQAAAWYRRAIAADPENAGGHIYLGNVLARQGRLHEAEEVYRAAIRCAKGFIEEAYLNLGLVLRARERFHEAADCLREALRLDPNYREARRPLRDVEACIKWLERPA